MTEAGRRATRLCLESLSADHAEAMFDGLSDARAYAFLPDDPPHSVDSLRQTYVRQGSGGPADGRVIWLNWMMRVAPDGPYAGYIQATVEPVRKSALVAYHVFPAFWRQGYAFEAVGWMVPHIVARYGLMQVEALIDTRNVASIALVKKLGFVESETLRDADYFKGVSSHEYRFVYHAT